MVKYDVEKVLTTPEQCRTVMERALARKDMALYRRVFAHYCKLCGAAQDDPSDPMVRAVYECVAALEQILTEKHGRNQPAGRTRQKLKNKGVHQSLMEWAELDGQRDGFSRLVEAGLAEFTVEAVVVRFASRFPPEVVARCDKTLREARGRSL